jgi:uncharacterized protein DUF3829
MARIDPQAMKNYRVDICYYGTLSLRQARDSYLASLGKDEPSEKKIPNFNPPAPKPTAPASPSGSASAGAKVAPAPSAKPAAGPAASAHAGPLPVPGGPAGVGGPDSRHAFDLALRIPHERNARSCSVAAGLKEPAMGDVDTAVGAYATFAVDLSKDIAAAANYYAHDEYKKDSFAKGKELHKKLVDEFGKLDEASDKLGAALAQFRKDHAPDASKMEEGEKLVATTYDDARDLVVVALSKKLDLAALKTATDKLDKSVQAMKDFGGSHQTDMWIKLTVPAFDGLLKTAKDAAGKAEKTLDQESFLNIVNSMSSVIDAKHRALSRAMVAKGQTETPPGMPPVPAPAPAESAAPQP